MSYLLTSWTDPKTGTTYSSAAITAQASINTRLQTVRIDIQAYDSPTALAAGKDPFWTDTVTPTAPQIDNVTQAILTRVYTALQSRYGGTVVP